MYCPHCGNQLGDGAKFCSKCGNRVSGAEDVDTQSRAVTNTVSTATPMINLAGGQTNLVLVAADVAILVLTFFVPWVSADIYFAYGDYSLPKAISVLYDSSQMIGDYSYDAADGLMAVMVMAIVILVVNLYLAGKSLIEHLSGSQEVDYRYFGVAIASGFFVAAILVANAVIREAGNTSDWSFMYDALSNVISPAAGSWATLAVSAVAHLAFGKRSTNVVTGEDQGA